MLGRALRSGIHSPAARSIDAYRARRRDLLTLTNEQISIYGPDGDLRYSSADDIDQTLKSIGSLGGSTVRAKEQVGDMGFAAYFKDSEGNVVGLWQNAS